MRRQKNRFAPLKRFRCDNAETSLQHVVHFTNARSNNKLFCPNQRLVNNSRTPQAGSPRSDKRSKHTRHVETINNVPLQFGRRTEEERNSANRQTRQRRGESLAQLHFPCECVFWVFMRRHDIACPDTHPRAREKKKKKKTARRAHLTRAFFHALFPLPSPVVLSQCVALFVFLIPYRRIRSLFFSQSSPSPTD